MQLTIEVLPAPLGPMIENNSPDLTPKLTSVSARTPPKRKETPRTSNVWSNRPSLVQRSAGSGAFRALGRLSLKLQHDPISAFPVRPCDEWQLLIAGTSDAIHSRRVPAAQLGVGALHR